MASPIGGNTATSVAQMPLNCSNSCGISASACAKCAEASVSLPCACSTQAEIVAGFGMIGLEQQQALVEARGFVELVLLLAAHRFRE